jgi:3-oxoacyl-[acyl-carrier-protein] synthase II
MKKQKKRVVVTGLGLVSCYGTDVDVFYQKLLDGVSGIRKIDTFDVSEYPTQIAGLVTDFSMESYIDPKQARRIDPFIQYGMVAGKKALEHAGITSDTLKLLDLERAGILIGSGMGGMNVFQDGVITVKEKGYRRLTPFFIPYTITNMAGALLAIDLGFRGPNYSISTACATGCYAIHSAAEYIRSGQADIMLCGGTEAPINQIGLSGFVAIKALSEQNEHPERASRPWDKARDGFVMGEGAGVLVLESLEHAQKRNAPILAEYLGGAINCDAYHLTSPREDGQGVAACIELALKDANLSKDQINYINAHATSTPAGDLCEVAAVHKVFGPMCSSIKINATKSLIGHSLGAAGAMASIAVIKAIETGEIHPTLNLENKEEALGDLDPVAGKKQSLKVKGSICNSFGFGGHNASLIFGPTDL